MRQYLLNVYQPDGPPPAPAVLEEIIADLEALNAQMRAADVWVFAMGLHPAESATVVRAGGETLITDGPYAEGREHIGGFTVIQVPDLDAALSWAEQMSRATTLPVEIRPISGPVTD